MLLLQPLSTKRHRSHRGTTKPAQTSTSPALSENCSQRELRTESDGAAVGRTTGSVRKTWQFRATMLLLHTGGTQGR